MTFSKKPQHIIEEAYEIHYDYECHYYENGHNKEIEKLSADELKVLNYIYETFKDYNSKEISNYSHNEKGYKETKNNEYISYKFANDIKLELPE